MQIRSGSLALAALMGCLAMQAPVTLYAADAIPAKATKGAMDGLLDLLRDRGILSGAEADEFKRKIEEEKTREVAEAVKKQVGPPPVQVVKNKELPPLKTTLPEEALTGLIDKAGKQQLLTPAEAALVKERYRKRAEYEKSVAAAKGQRLPEKDLRALVEVMREQGLVGADEAQELTTRLSSRFEAEEATAAKRGSAVELEKMPNTVITAERQIAYVRSSMPQEDLVAMIDKAGKQRVLLPWEVAFVKSRYQKKAGLDQVAEAVSGEVKTEMRAEVNKTAGEKVASAAKSIAAPAWTKKISLSGDMRLRYESTFFDKGNNYDSVISPLTLSLMNTTNDRQRIRIRARLNANVKVNDEVKAVIGLATGTISDPVSTNQTLGNYFNKKAIQLDQAYMAWQPGEWLTLMGGHFPNPWFSTDLVWDKDLNFDGVAAKLRYRIDPSWNMFLTGGAFPIQEVEFSQRDKWLIGGQLGAEYRKEEGMTAKVGVAYYSYYNTTGKQYSQKDLDNYSSPQFMQKGNSLFNINPLGTTVPALLVDYNELNATAQVDLGYWHPFHLMFGADYVYNLGFNRNEAAQRAGKTPGEIAEDIEGYQFTVAAGYPKVREQWDWRAFLSYKRLGADAVLDAYTDSDFNLGGTNAKGWILGGELGLLKNTSILARWLTSNEIRSIPFSVDLIQVDLNVRF